MDAGTGAASKPTSRAHSTSPSTSVAISSRSSSPSFPGGTVPRPRS